MDAKKARLRNLRMQILKISILDKTLDYKGDFSKEEINKKLFFRENDMRKYLLDIFEIKSNKYYLTQESLNLISKWENNHKEAYVTKKSQYIEAKRSFLSNFDNFDKNIDFEIFKQQFTNLFDEVKDKIELLHWGSLPVYNDEFLEKSEFDLDDNPLCYYNDYYTLKDLYMWLRNEENWKPSLLGDCNLNQELTFSVYTSRWGHRDLYRVQRTIEGWHINFISINGDSNRDGEGSLFANLNQDNVLYSEGDIKEAMQYLWNLADQQEMSTKELQEKLQSIADWISEIEMAREDHKPSWL